MTDIFKEVLQNADSVQEKLLGPTYPYYKNIKTPSEIGMSDKGTIKQMGKNIDIDKFKNLFYGGFYKNFCVI